MMSNRHLLTRTIRKLRCAVRRRLPWALILLYHRVAEVPSDPQLLCVTPAHFQEHLEHLSRNYDPISLRDLNRRLPAGWVPHRAVVITFDDGYADNLWNAKPLLERYEVPATIFTTAANAGENREFWWDQLERLLLKPGTLPRVLNLSLSGEIHTWDLNGAAWYSEADFNRHRAWHVLEEECPTPRHEIYRTLCRSLRPLCCVERDAVLAELAAWAGGELAARSDYRALTPDELTQLAAGGLVEIGAHTMTHPVLSALPVEAQWAEIINSKNGLRQVLGQPVTTFAYPFGDHSDYTTDTVRLVKDASFECACSNFPGLVRWGSDPYQLPRFLVRDWDGEEFARRLRVFLNA